MEEVVARTNMLAALKRVEKNAGAPGVDQTTVAELRDQCRAEWPRIREELLKGTYRPKPVRRVEIPKSSGHGKRPLGIPTVMDRLIQQALLQVLIPIFDPTFADQATGSGPGGAPTTRWRRRGSTSKRATRGSWTWTWKASLTGSTTTS